MSYNPDTEAARAIKQELNLSRQQLAVLGETPQCDTCKHWREESASCEVLPEDRAASYFVNMPGPCPKRLTTH